MNVEIFVDKLIQQNSKHPFSDLRFGLLFYTDQAQYISW